MRQHARLIYEGLLVASVAWVFMWPAIAPTFGRIEGKIAPVATGFTIQSVQPHLTASHIKGTFVLERAAECDYRGVEWFIVSDTRDVLVEVAFLSGSVVRSDGVNAYGPWQIGMKPETLIESSRAEAHHQCHWRIWGKRVPKPWITKTQLFPPTPR